MSKTRSNTDLVAGAIIGFVVVTALATCADDSRAQASAPTAQKIQPKFDEAQCHSWTGASITGPTNAWTKCERPAPEPVPVTKVIIEREVVAPPNPPQALPERPIRQ